MSEQITAYFNNIANGVKSFITGLSLTFEHFKNKKENVATLQYPHEKFPIPEKKIGFEQSEYNVIRSRLHVDIDDCISCRMCERACPVDCIKIEDVKPKKDIEFDCGKTSNETQKKLLVTRFTIDMSECMYCNLCVYPCPEECIYMVGGPNESKHEIDYEFSQYKREGMIFEFANTSDEDLMTVGADDYLKKKKEKQEKIIEGERLLGIKAESKPAAVAQTATVSEATPVAAAPVVGGIDNLTIKCVDIIDDLKLRAAAKKVFFKSKKAGEDDITKIDKIVAAINGMDGYSPDLEQKLIALKPEAVVPTAVASTTEAPVSAPVDNLTIKCVDIIDDLKLRAAAKKVFFKSKKAGEDDITKIDKIVAAINGMDGYSPDLEQKLIALKPEAVVPTAVASTTEAPTVETVKESTLGLFDIKLLNDIEDIPVRAALKKVYMAAKKASKNSNEAIPEMIGELELKGKLTDEIKLLLEGILK